MIRKHEMISKQWGFEEVIDNRPEYCGKILHIVKDFWVSFHKHLVKKEVFYLETGKIILFYSEQDNIKNADTLEMEPGDSFYVYPGLNHAMLALEDARLFEFSSQHFDEDSYRIHKGGHKDTLEKLLKGEINE